MYGDIRDRCGCTRIYGNIRDIREYTGYTREYRIYGAYTKDIWRYTGIYRRLAAVCHMVASSPSRWLAPPSRRVAHGGHQLPDEEIHGYTGI